MLEIRKWVLFIFRIELINLKEIDGRSDVMKKVLVVNCGEIVIWIFRVCIELDI